METSNIDKIISWLVSIDLNLLLPSLFGLIGVILGILINEHFKQKDRESFYSETIFNKKLHIYEELYDKISQLSDLSNKIITDKKLSKDNRTSLWFKGAVLEISNFLDKNSLYINEEISVHCMLTLIGVEDIYYLNEEEKSERIKKYNQEIVEAKTLIKQETGISRIERFFKKINKQNVSTSYIDFYKREKKKYK